MTFDFQKTREDAIRTREALIERQKQIALDKKKLDDENEEVRRQLIGLDQILDGVEFVTSDIPPDLEPMGFTDQIRKILAQTTVPLFPTQIRELLTTQGHTGSSPRNLLISVHTVLDRIDAELEKVKIGEKIAYISKNSRYLPKQPGETTTVSPNAIDSLVGRKSRRRRSTGGFTPMRDVATLKLPSLNPGPWKKS